MMMTRYFGPMEQGTFDYRVDELFNEAIRTFGEDAAVRPVPWNVYEKGDWLWIEASVPGLGGKDIDVTVRDGVLTVSVPHKAEDNDESMVYFVRELGRDTASRSMRLPAHVDADHATATCKDGMLTIGFPKRIEAVARQIKVEDRLAG